MSTPLADSDTPVHTEDQLRAAWARIRGAHWPATFEETMEDELRASCVHAAAAGFAHKRPDTRPAGTLDAPECRVHQAACLDVQARRRCANCPHRPPPPVPHFAPPPGYVDIKRRASGERDDD